MKFTLKGFIKLEVKLIPVKEKNGILFSIIDTGLGIKKEDQKKLFRLLNQFDYHEIYNKTGTGIGLYQSQKFAKKLGFSHHQGIQVQSEWEKGSQFSFILENKEIKPLKDKPLRLQSSHSQSVPDHLSDHQIVIKAHPQRQRLQ
jgi:signal transduction histidine kinase